MKPLLVILRTKLFLLSFLFTSTVIIAATITLEIKHNKKEVVKTAEHKKEKKKTTKKVSLNQSSVLSKSDGPTLTSDAADYAPGTTATLTGSGFLSGESVKMQVLHADYHEGDPIGEDHEPWYVTADDNGNVVTTWHVCEDDCVGELLRATADGQDPAEPARHAEVLFTDSPQITSVSVSVQSPNPVTAGNNATYTVTITRQNSNDDFDAEVTVSSLPSGITFSLFQIDPLVIVGNIITIPGSSPPGSTTYELGLTLSSNACNAYNSPINFTVTVTKQNGQSEVGNDNESGNGVLNIINDNTAPTITSTGADLSLGCNPLASDINAALGTATATDVCASPTVTASDGTVVSTSCSRSQTRKFTAIDGVGNTSTTSRTATWKEDNTPPQFWGSYATVPLACNPSESEIAAALGTANATDGCGATTITHSDGSVSTSTCSRSLTRTFTATDECGNTATKSRTVTWTEDNTPPQINANGTTLALGCNPLASDIDAALGTASATDGCGTTTITPTDGDIITSSCSRSRTRTFTVVDGCGNTNSTSRTVTWTEDNIPPTFTSTFTTVTLGCNPLASDITGALGSASATDACGAATVTSPADGSVTSNGCSRSQKRIFIVTDGCNNTASACRTVTWTEDNTPPTFTNTFTTVPLGCNPAASNITSALGSAAATDACGAATVTSPADGSVTSDGCSRSQKRIFIARDGCNNTVSACRTVTWTEDNIPPTFTSTFTTVTLGCNPLASDITGALGSASATDACGAATVTSPPDGSVMSNGCSRSQKRIFIVTDGCNNTASACRTVTWTEDNTPPTFTSTFTTVPLGCNPAASNITSALGSAAATDACGAATVTSPADGSVTSDGCSRSQKRIFIATDGCNNTVSACRTVTWTEDKQIPVITAGGTTLTLGCNPASSDINAALGTATASDNCGVGAPTASDGAVTGTCTKSQTRTWNVTDACGNSAVAVSRTVTWKDDQSPPTLAPAQICLWPPNHKMVDIILASDGCVVSSGYATVISNEPKNDIGDGNTDADMAWPGGVEQPGDPYTVQGPVTPGPDGKLHIQIRAERSGVFALVSPDFGREYTVTYSATDACGNTATATTKVTVGHNIVNPKPGSAYPINTVVNFSGTFWDVPGNKHTVKWLIDGGTSTTGTITSEPSGNKLGKATGSFKPTAAGVYKLQMNITDQKGVTSYATTNGDFEEYFVAYDPRGGYTYGGGQFISPAGALTAKPALSDMVKFGFTSNYYKNATYPKGETELDFKLASDGYSFAFNALNYEYLVVTGAKAQYKGSGKTIINGIEQGGNAFILTVIDGKNSTNPSGVDKIRLKIYNKNTGAVIYDNQMGASETADPTTAVDSPNALGTDIVVVSSTTAVSADLTQNAQMEITPEVTKFNVNVSPNPTEHHFTLYLEGGSNEKVQLVVYDAIGRQVKKIEKGDGSGPISFGENLKVGIYIVEVRQGANRKTLKLVKQ